MQRYANLNNTLSIHGLDIGNATLVNDQGLILDAKITTKEPVKNVNRILINNKPCWLGYGQYDTEFVKVKKEHYIDMLYSLLALSTSTVYNFVGLGLPLTQWKTDREKLIDMVLENNCKIVKVDDEIEKTIIIQDVEVFPEGVSTIKDDEECIVIDLGGGTTDCGLVINSHGKRKVEQPITIPKGTIKLYDRFANELISRGEDVTLDDAERILTRGYLYKEDDIVFDECEEFIEELVTKLRLNYNLKIYPISITGGGGELLYNKLIKRLDNSRITLQSNPVKANAINFKELALSVFGEE